MSMKESNEFIPGFGFGMKKGKIVKYNNTIETIEYVTELRIGSLITAYHSGIWRVIEIEKRFYETERDIPSDLKDTKKIGDEYSPLITYEKVCDTKGNQQNKRIIKQCDSSLCKPAENYIKEQEEILDKLKNIIKNNATNN